MIVIESHKKKIETIQKMYPGAIIHDVTSHAKDQFIRFSPFYPVMDIPVPFSPGWTSTCVEAIWQGLKVFEDAGCDVSLFKNTTMKNIKRTTRRFGQTKGHKKGVFGDEMLDYIAARKQIYIPAYKWVLDHKLQFWVNKLRAESADHTVVLLDYDTNSNVDDPSSPLSHASLIKAYIEGNYPECDGQEGSPTKTAEEAESPDFKVGQEVVHPTFGEGTVLKIEGDRIQVKFEVGVKLLVIRLAHLTCK